MYNCIFTPHCIEKLCDKSCPILAETSYLLERNDITMNSKVFKETPKNFSVERAIDILSAARELGVLWVKCTKGYDTVEIAQFLTYCAICQYWQGSRLHCDVYNLKYGTYMNAIKQSWSVKDEPDALQYMRIWSESAKVLIISNMDYVNFNDFECQTLLSLIQLRKQQDKTTILVTPPYAELVGKSTFRDHLKRIFIDNKYDITSPLLKSGGESM